MLKKRITEAKKKYRSRQTNMSFNLEEYMWDKQKQKENPKEKRGVQGEMSFIPGHQQDHI